MFAVVRTGGKQYRVAAGDRIVVEKLSGDAGATISLGDVLLAGEGGDLKATKGLIVSAEIVAQAKADKVVVFKKRRRHNYRRKNGHRQQHTILKILSVGTEKPKAEKRAEASAAVEAKAAPVPAPVAKKPAAEDRPIAAKAAAPAKPVAVKKLATAAKPAATDKPTAAKKPAAKKAAKPAAPKE